MNPANVICTVADDAVSGAVLNCSSLPLSSLEVALALDGLTDGGAGVPQPFVIGSSTAGSMYLIETGPQLNSLQAPCLRLNVLTMPQYVIGASVCEPQSVSAIALNGTMLDYGHCQMSPSAIPRFNITVTLIHVDKPPYFTIPSLNFTTSAVGSLWQPIWVPLSTVVVNPDPVYPYNITSFALLQGPCSSASAQYYLPFAIGPSDGSLYYSVAGGLSAWSSPVSLCILAVDGGQLNASLDVTVWLAPVPEQLIVSPFSLSITHYAPGASTTSVSVLFSPGSQAGVSWTVQPSTQPWLTYTSNTFASSIQFHINSTGLAGLKATLYETMLAVYTTGM